MLFWGILALIIIVGGTQSHLFIDHISPYQFQLLTEFSHLADVAYCVPSPGISEPFNCTSACSRFNGIHLITEFATDHANQSCTGYIAVDDGSFSNQKKIIVAFRGTNTLKDILVDSDFLQSDLDLYGSHHGCKGCGVHAGFHDSYKQLEPIIVNAVVRLMEMYDDTPVLVVGHSLGGAMALLAGISLSFNDAILKRGVLIVTFGQPCIGNQAFVDWLDLRFRPLSYNGSPFTSPDPSLWRVTHRNDPVCQLPPSLDYKQSSNELYISSDGLPDSSEQIWICLGQNDPRCNFGHHVPLAFTGVKQHVQYISPIGFCPYL
ncbi:hypothetical protein CANCADRAFT_689 [Tortispora caseinolytica NRRL Y-17796]|uniref:triacylglycerol lipase n=1 Tax=Tortispora caseinolytica NRRL Y-17796 TaxID=767744 RepID=A0A1E4TKA2_9ASCO|nr:hypothetical protein CANCADRAFT_689 [Tortispora caseinolytica NRRL Y-17796]